VGAQLQAPEAGSGSPAATGAEVQAPVAHAPSQAGGSDKTTGRTAGGPSASGTGPGPTKAVAGTAAQKDKAKPLGGDKAVSLPGAGSGRSPNDESAATGLAAGVQKLVSTNQLYGGTGACTPATLSEITVGNLSTLSGVLGELFAPVVPALKTFVAAQNVCGGLNGHRIKLIIRDDQGDPATAATLAQEMIKNDKILAFVGNIEVLTVHAIVDTVRKAGIPVIGGDLVSDAWFNNSLFFPQASSIQSFAVAYLNAIVKHFKVKVVANVFCFEVPLACGTQNKALLEMAPKFGVNIVLSPEVSLTQPSFLAECLRMKNAGVQAVILSVDAASAQRIARSCEQVGFFPKTLIHPIGVGNEQQLFGNKWLGGTYIPMNTFPHMADRTPAERYYQASVKRFHPGFATGGAASSGWSSAALLVAAAANLPAENPTSQSLLDTLYEFKAQKFTELGGLTASPLTYQRDGIPLIPYCHFNAIVNADDNGYSSYTTTPECSDLLAPSDPQSIAKRARS
jgi:branched-chain amino acid transport system substrate-binding protein